MFGCNGCNTALSRGQTEAEARLLRSEFAKLDVFLELGIAVCHALVRVADPEPQQVFWYTLPAQMRDPVSAEGMKAALVAAHLLEDWLREAKYINGSAILYRSWRSAATSYELGQRGDGQGIVAEATCGKVSQPLAGSATAH